MKLSRYNIISNNSYTRGGEDEHYKIYYNTLSANSIAIKTSHHEEILKGNLKEIPNDIANYLIKNKFLTDKNYDEELAAAIEFQRLNAEDPTFRSFILLPTQWCNLGCDYCGQSHFRSPLSKSHRETVRRRVLEAINTESVNAVSIGWFGGEPLVAYKAILDMSKEFISEAEGICNYSAHIVTNGSLLTEDKIYSLVNDCNITRFDITIDGIKETHDIHRPSKKPGGSFDKIIDALRIFKNGHFTVDPVVIIRVNLDNRNYHDIKNLVKYLYDKDLVSPRFEFNIAPIYSWSNDISSIELSQEEFSNIELDIFNDLNKYGFFYNVFPDRPMGVLCSAVTRNSEVVSATGNIFSCTEYPLVVEHEKNDSLTNLISLGIPTLRPKHQFDDWLIDIEQGNFPCNKCSFFPVCGGSCPKQWHNNVSPCPSYKYAPQKRLDHIAMLSGLSVK